MGLPGTVLPPTPLWEEIAERIDTKDYIRISIPKTPYRYIDEDMHNWPHRLIVGSHHITDKKDRTKYIAQWPYPHGELATEYFYLCIEKSGYKLGKVYGKCTGKEPIYFTGPSKGLYAYVDIASCYFSLYRVLTLDLYYDPIGFVVGQGNIPWYSPVEFGLHKPIRNMLFGIMRKTSSTIYVNGSYNEAQSHTPTFRPAITTYVLDTMQAIKQDSLRYFKIHIWLTDAAILPVHQAKAFQEYLVNEWLLNSRLKWSGPASLFCSNCWQVGERITEQLKRYTLYEGKPIDTGHPVNIPKLKAARKWLMETANPQLMPQI